MSVAEAAVLADEFVLTHKPVYTQPRMEARTMTLLPNLNSTTAPTRSKEARESFCCHKVSHVIAGCLTLKQKHPPSERNAKGVGLIHTMGGNKY